MPTVSLNDPVPEPICTVVSTPTCGNGVVLQTIPRSVTVAPPLFVTSPPSTAVVALTLAGTSVVTVAGPASVRKLKSLLEYPVPAELVA